MMNIKLIPLILGIFFATVFVSSGYGHSLLGYAAIMFFALYLIMEFSTSELGDDDGTL